MKAITYILMALAFVTLASATPTFYWIAPYADGDILSTFPTEIRVTATTNQTGLLQCNLTINGIMYSANLSSRTVEINRAEELPLSNSTITLWCLDDALTTLQETKIAYVWKHNIQERRTKEMINIALIALAYIGLIFAISKTDEKIFKVGLSMILLLLSMMLTTQLNGAVTYVPVYLASVILLYNMVRD